MFRQVAKLAGALSVLTRASHHSGTGKHRKYDASSVYDAAILNAVARAGLHVVTQRYLLEALSTARHARQKWERTKTRGPLFLEISHQAVGGRTATARPGLCR
jgi:hypothetical protein